MGRIADILDRPHIARVVVVDGSARPCAARKNIVLARIRRSMGDDFKVFRVDRRDVVVAQGLTAVGQCCLDSIAVDVAVVIAVAEITRGIEIAVFAVAVAVVDPNIVLKALHKGKIGLRLCHATAGKHNIDARLGQGCQDAQHRYADQHSSQTIALPLAGEPRCCLVYGCSQLTFLPPSAESLRTHTFVSISVIGVSFCAC